MRVKFMFTELGRLLLGEGLVRVPVPVPVAAQTSVGERSRRSRTAR